MRHLRTLTLALAVLIAGTLPARAQVGGPQNTQFSAPTKSTAAWTSATSNNTALTVTVTNLSKVIVTLHATTTMTAGGLNFEVDDGTGTWWAIRAVRIGGSSTTGQSESTYTLSVVDQAWAIPVGGWTQARVRLNPVITGSGTANVAILPTAEPFDSVAGTCIVDTNGNCATTSVDATTGQTAQPTGPQPKRFAITTLPTAVTNGQAADTVGDKFGRDIVLPITIRDLTGTQTTTLSATTSETTIVTAASGVFNDLVMLIVSNTSASTNTRIDFRDTTGGTVLFSLWSQAGAPPTGFVLPLPIPQTTVNTNWTAQCATSTTDVRIYAVYAKNK